MGKSERNKSAKKAAKTAKNTQAAENAEKVAESSRKRTRSGKIVFEENPLTVTPKSRKRKSTENTPKTPQKEGKKDSKTDNKGKNNNAQIIPGNSGKKAGDKRTNSKVIDETQKEQSLPNSNEKGVVDPANKLNVIPENSAEQKDTEEGDPSPKGDGIELHVNVGDDDLDDDESRASGQSSGESESSGSESESSSEEEDPEEREIQQLQSKKAKLNRWKDDPDFLDIVDVIVAKRRNEAKKDSRKEKRARDKDGGHKSGKEVIKSPSNATLYAPMLSRVDEFMPVDSNPPRRIVEGITNLNIDKGVPTQNAGNSRESEQSDSETTEKRSEQRKQGEDPQTYADQAILAAEQFKATVAPPENRGMAPGKYVIDDMPDHFIQSALHLDEATKVKIRAGKYVDLEKLLPKDKPLRHVKKEPRYEMVNRGGWSYWAPVEDKTQTINNFGKWEQAFRVYATIYTQANPLRSTEILRYIETINNAALTFVWNNIAEYDYAFRHYMEEKPYRSWAQTNLQLWSTCMHEHVRNIATPGQKPNDKKDWREISCWRYNRNACTRGANCRFEHRCSYCGSFSHIYPTCPKRGKKSKDQREDRRTSSSGSKSPVHKEKRDKRSRSEENNRE